MSLNNIFTFIKNKVFLFEKIQHIKNNSIREYLTNLLSFKNILLKLILILIFSLLFTIIFFTLRTYALENWKCLMNAGSGLNTFTNNQALVYGLKITISIFFILFSLLTNKWYFYLSLYVIGWNSLLNVIDKSLVDIYQANFYYDTVVDYIPFDVWKFYNNIADIFIFVGLFGLIISFIYYAWLKFKQDKEIKDDNNNKNNIWAK